jgi:hypothetical protein
MRKSIACSTVPAREAVARYPYRAMGNRRRRKAPRRGRRSHRRSAARYRRQRRQHLGNRHQTWACTRDASRHAGVRADALGYFRAAGYELLSVSADHAAAVAALPALHREPFDRIIVAQALHEPWRLITHDPMVKRYSDAILLV